MDSRIATALTFLVTFILANDADYWIAQSDRNANHRLTEWLDLVSEYQDGATNGKKVSNLLMDLEMQLKEALDHSRYLMPNLHVLALLIQGVTAGNPNPVNRAIFQTSMSLFGRKRDNKSYYLLDGAQKWAGRRVDALVSCGRETCDKLREQLITIQGNIIEARETLETRAQRFVKAVRRMNQLRLDFDRNLPEIQRIANDLASDPGEGTKFVQLSGEVYLEAKNLVHAYSQH
ncbi:hypothetical protein HDE_05033 [Halotydeus destructor]|nr:hypothetical protein HDE_05033 [Halotydeus destructor]